MPLSVWEMLWSFSGHVFTGGYMFAVMLWLLLVLKHGSIAHILDFGYSSARAPRNHLWPLSLCLLIIAEVSVTVMVARAMDMPMAWYVGAVEALGCAATCVAERKTAVRYMLRTHLLCESTVLLIYVVMVLTMLSP